ncbi:MAG: patatin-like phospholipase family protein [Clostridia bacterium]|nr:patatin-like phospholipase family protein [Clostridia bacterium]MBO7318880.1 patatin-like phospholipase family protein [Clostridia bacterium]
MNKYGLVLAGGGGKGAYQIGAWAALREMGIEFEAIAGASIGGINGALIAAGDYEKATEFWHNISVEKGVKFAKDLPDSENLFSRKNWGVLFKEFIKTGGIDASPAGDFISNFVDEKKVRDSGISLCVIAVQMTQGVIPREIFIHEMPEGQLVDYLLASANIPLAQNIGPEGEKFLDGGAYDNTPAMTLKKRGYNRLIIVDISNIKGVAHSLNYLNSEIVHIRPYDIDDLGATFDFDDAIIDRRIKLGYLDTRKAFSYLLGNIYYFQPDVFRAMVKRYSADTVEQIEHMAHLLKIEKAKIYEENEFISIVKAEYEKEVIAYMERQQALEQEEDGIMLHLKKRFMDKKSFENYPLAVELFDTLNPGLKAIPEADVKELTETANEV